MNDLDSLPIKIEALDGLRMGVTAKSIRFKVSFKYPKPISFSVKIIFYDQYAAHYNFFISGTVDNSIFTI